MQPYLPEMDGHRFIIGHAEHVSASMALCCGSVPWTLKQVQGDDQRKVILLNPARL
jgi:hypothetical protein